LDGIEFEGGFIRKWSQPGVHRDYVTKIQRSTVVFNTPARLGGHGWKLAEFMALGKAIITLPPERAMPAPLVHGQHVHFLDGSRPAIREAIERLCADPDYRQQLESGARSYYLEHLEPRRVIARILDFQEHGADTAARQGTAASVPLAGRKKPKAQSSRKAPNSSPQDAGGHRWCAGKARQWVAGWWRFLKSRLQNSHPERGCLSRSGRERQKGSRMSGTRRHFRPRCGCPSRAPGFCSRLSNPHFLTRPSRFLNLCTWVFQLGASLSFEL
jgi:hypothetical protein